MGFIKTLSIRAVEAVFVFFLIALLPGLPPDMEFTTQSISPALPLEGELALNEKLNNAEHLFEGLIKGPEALVSYNGELYTGLHGGEIVKIVKDKLVPVVKFGKKCDGFWEERICGRPLGMEFDKNGNLYVADAYYGLFKFNVKSGVTTTLVPINEPINGRAPKIPNSVAVATDGSVYWSDSSSDMMLQDGVFTLLGDGSGRLLKYDAKKNSSQVLIDKLQFANGVVLSPKEDYVLVAETAQSRIHRYYLKGPKKGTKDIFIDGLPGLPDNLRSDGEGGFFIPLVLARDSKHPAIFQVIGPFPLLRKFLARLLALVEMPFSYINKISPNYYSNRVVHWIGHFESVSMLGPKRFSLLKVDSDGKIKSSFHCLDGSLSGISEVAVFEDAYYFGSPYNSYLGRVKLNSPVPRIHIKTQSPKEVKQ